MAEGKHEDEKVVRELKGKFSELKQNPDRTVFVSELKNCEYIRELYDAKPNPTEVALL
jgi:hypothetical protein